MNEQMQSDPGMMPVQPQGGRKTWVIVLIVVFVLCCLCALALGFAWQFGDLILQMVGINP